MQGLRFDLFNIFSQGTYLVAKLDVFFRGGNLYRFEFVFLLVLAFAFVAEEAVRVDDDAGVFAGRPGAGAGGGHSRLGQDHRTTGAHLMFGIVSGLV